MEEQKEKPQALATTTPIQIEHSTNHDQEK